MNRAVSCTPPPAHRRDARTLFLISEVFPGEFTMNHVASKFANLVWALLVLGAFVAPRLAQSQTYSVVHYFTGAPSTRYAYGAVAQGRDGDMYGASQFGGTSDNGSVYKMTPSGAVTVLYSFSSYDGCFDGLTLGSDGNFYGACQQGGTSNDGFVYKITPSGTLTVLHNFTGSSGDGAVPAGPPMQATDGNFYGTTYMGGTNNLGTVYKMTPAGTLTTLHSFTSEANVNYPTGPLFQGSDGNLYGTSYASGSALPPPPNNGAVYKITTVGKITVLHTFAASPSDGQNPLYGVIQATDGNFYGVTQQGGANNVGTVYKMTAAGKVTLLHSFATADFGYLPEQGLVQTADGNFYGAASSCYGPGCYDAGSIFKITPTGTFSVPHDFDGTNGFNPSSPLLAHTNGILYGVTQQGGTGNDSVFYSLNIGAKPFLRLALTSGKAGTLVGMFGQGFDNTSVVKFGGVAATSITLTGSTYTVATRGSSHWQSHRNHGLDHAHQLADLYRARFLDQRRRDADSSLWSCHWGRRNQSVCSG